jgi:hypothetical protein
MEISSQFNAPADSIPGKEFSSKDWRLGGLREGLDSMEREYTPVSTESRNLIPCAFSPYVIDIQNETTCLPVWRRVRIPPS